MTFQQELASWSPFGLANHGVQSVPTPGASAPSTPKLRIPRSDGRPVVITFLRHCGCPFAEKTFRQLRDLASSNSETAFIAVSHSDEAATNEWLDNIGGKGNAEVIIDPESEIYGQWGLGPSSFWHVLNPAALFTAYKTGRDEGIGVRPTKSGSRWQTAGSFAVDGKGTVVWGGASQRADDMPDLESALLALHP